MFVLALEVELLIRESQSLKDKRAVVKPIVEGARRRFCVSAAEIGRQDNWRQAQLGFAVVASSEHHASDTMASVERFVWSHPEAEVTSMSRRWLE